MCNHVSPLCWGWLVHPIVWGSRYKLRWERSVGFGVYPPFPIIDGSLQTAESWEARHLLLTWMHSPPRDQAAIMLWKLVENVKYEDIYEVSGHPGCILDFLQIENLSFWTPQLIYLCCVCGFFFKKSCFPRRFPVGFLSFLLTFRKAGWGRLRYSEKGLGGWNLANLEDFSFFPVLFLSLFLATLSPPKTPPMGKVGREDGGCWRQGQPWSGVWARMRFSSLIGLRL